MDEFFDIGVISKKMHELLAEYYATLKLNCEEDAWNARKLMAEKAEELGIKDYTNYAELEQLISKFDKEYRTLDSVVYATRELADKKRALKTFYQTLAIDTEENALNARKLMAEKAKELELEDYESYPALEEVIAKFDLAERTIAGHVFDSREEAMLQRNAYKLYTEANFCDSEENALKAKEALAAFAEKNSIDVSWLMIDIDVALKHFDEELRISGEPGRILIIGIKITKSSIG